MKLLEAEFTQSQIQVMDHDQMTVIWTEIVAAGQDKPVTYQSVIDYDPGLEKQRLEFGERKMRQQEAEERKLREERERERQRE